MAAARKVRKAAVGDPVLASWAALNLHIMTADEAECRRLLELERRGRDRRIFVLRIHSRLNRVRAARERARLDERRAAKVGR